MEDEEPPFTVWAIADLHLSFGTPGKSMEVFGEQWRDWTVRLHKAWSSRIAAQDLVLIPGDISWAMRQNEVAPDLAWIDALPGTKVLIRGNHDYWWSSPAKVAKLLPPSLHAVHSEAFLYRGIAIAGSRLWDTAEYGFDFDSPESPATPSQSTAEEMDNQEKIYLRELQRLERSLATLPKEAAMRIAMTHYPPIGADLKESRASQLFERYGVTLVLFGHLHNIAPGTLPFGCARGVEYRLCACDYLLCEPLELFKVSKGMRVA